MLPPVLLAAAAGGWQPALLAALAALFAAWRWFQPELATLLALALVAALQIALVGLLARAIGRLEEEKARLAAAGAAERRIVQELNHRFANGMQLVASVLSLQGARLASLADARAAMEAAVERLHVVAAIHRGLQGAGLGEVPLAEAFRAIAAGILHGAGAEGIRLEVELAPVPLGIGRAASLAMIIAEAVGNAVRHAFADRPGGRLRIALAETAPGTLTLSVADDGIGLADAVLDHEDRFGLQIVRSLAARLEGTASLAAAPDGGAVLSVTFPAEERECR